MPSHKKGESSEPKDDEPKDIRDSRIRTRKGSSIIYSKNDVDYNNLRRMKAKHKMHPKNICKTPNVQRIEEEPAANQSSGSSNATVRFIRFSNTCEVLKMHWNS